MLFGVFSDKTWSSKLISVVRIMVNFSTKHAVNNLGPELE